MRPPSREGPRVFINYRPEDAAGHAGRLYDALVERYGAELIFNVDAGGPRRDDLEATEQSLARADVLIALIGSDWLTAADHGLDKPSDRVRLEIETALRKGMRVVPVLVQGAEMPSPDALPEALRPLSRRHPVELREWRWRDDVRRLVADLEVPAPMSLPRGYADAGAEAEPPEHRRNPFRRWFEGRGQRKADEDEVSGVERDVE